MKLSLTSSEASKVCGLSASSIRKWIKKGELRSYSTPGGRIRIIASDLQDFMRRFRIPLHNMVREELIFLLVVPDKVLRERLSAGIATFFPEALLKSVTEKQQLLACLCQVRPHIIIAQLHPEIEISCEAVRKILAPWHVRIGFITDKPVNFGDDDAPETVLPLGADYADLQAFICNLAADFKIEDFSKNATAKQLYKENFVSTGISANIVMEVVSGVEFAGEEAEVLIQEYSG